MSDLINDAGKKIMVIAELPSGVKECLTTTEQLSEFFKKYPFANLKFISLESNN